MQLRVAFGWSFLAVWGAGTTVALGSLMVSHTVALPEPTSVDRFAAAARREIGQRDGLLHVIPADCSCTDALVDHLVARGAGEGEVVAFVGPRRPRRMGLESAGYRVVAVAPEEVERRVGVVAGPVWLALRQDEVAYAGGYYGRPAAVEPLLVPTLADVEAGRPVRGLPIFGCAVDAGLKRQLDPLGLQQALAGP
jgi:hypothetical protein